MPLSPTVRQLTALLLLLTLSTFMEAEGREVPRGIESKVLDKVPSVSERLEGYENPDVVIDRLSAIPLHSIEGVWRFAAEGTLMAIERTEDRGLHPEEAGTMTYRMIVVRAADLSLRPGTVMGYLAPTAKRGVYDARIYTGRTDAGTQLHSPKKFTLPSAATATPCASTGGDYSHTCIATYSAAKRRVRAISRVACGSIPLRLYRRNHAISDNFTLSPQTNRNQPK